MTADGKHFAIIALIQIWLITFILIGAKVTLKYRLGGTPSRVLSFIISYGIFFMLVPIVWGACMFFFPSLKKDGGFLLGWIIVVVLGIIFLDVLFGRHTRHTHLVLLEDPQGTPNFPLVPVCFISVGITIIIGTLIAWWLKSSKRKVKAIGRKCGE